MFCKSRIAARDARRERPVAQDEHLFGKPPPCHQLVEKRQSRSNQDQPFPAVPRRAGFERSEEHTSELQSLMSISYAVFCLQKKKNTYSTKKNHSCTHTIERNLQAR